MNLVGDTKMSFSMVWSLMICDLISKYSFQGGTADIFLWMGPIQCCRDIFLMNYY